MFQSAQHFQCDEAVCQLVKYKRQWLLMRLLTINVFGVRQATGIYPMSSVNQHIQKSALKPHVAVQLTLSQTSVKNKLCEVWKLLSFTKVLPTTGNTINTRDTFSLVRLGNRCYKADRLIWKTCGIDPFLHSLGPGIHRLWNNPPGH